MTARYLMLPAAVAALFAVMGCSKSEPPPVPVADEQPTAKEQPNLPVPVAPTAKTDAKARPWSEQIVGTWKMIKLRDVQVAADVEHVVEYTTDGKYFVRSKSNKLGPQKASGTYTLNGNTLRSTSDAAGDRPSETWEDTIDALSEDELRIVTGPPTRREHDVYKRVVQKQPL